MIIKEINIYTSTPQTTIMGIFFKAFVCSLVTITVGVYETYHNITNTYMYIHTSTNISTFLFIFLSVYISVSHTPQSASERRMCYAYQTKGYRWSILLDIAAIIR
jgi:hypothetical protein